MQLWNGTKFTGFSASLKPTTTGSLRLEPLTRKCGSKTIPFGNNEWPWERDTSHLSPTIKGYNTGFTQRTLSSGCKGPTPRRASRKNEPFFSKIARCDPVGSWMKVGVFCILVSWEEFCLRNGNLRTSALSPPQISHVIMGQLINSTGPQFPHSGKGKKENSFSKFVVHSR